MTAVKLGPHPTKKYYYRFLVGCERCGEVRCVILCHGSYARPLCNPCSISKHGDTGTRLHAIWMGMIFRTGPECKGYARELYYGRGIRTCDEWRGRGRSDGYLKFKEWALSNGYRDDLTIDRIDVDGGYCPGNCKWSTRKEQSLNTRRSISYNRKLLATGSGVEK